MKNKKLLVFLLAAVSATAVGTAACKKDKGHEHSYTWHSSEEGHWQECVDGDDKKDIEAHVDAKNNATNADGKDGKCDVCDYALKQSVTYNMGGHGTAPDSLSVDFGAIINKPSDPEEDAWDFLGWYKDAAFTTAFDFTAPINDDTVIYAKWEENTNPGESKKYAIKLEVDNDGYATDTATFGKKGVMYFSYTAVKDGRYTVSLGLGVNSAKCYFTSDKDKDGTKYGHGQTADSHVYDIHKGEKVIISLKCDEELAADAQVGIAIQATYNEPLPADSWFSGIFADSTYTLVFDRENSGIEFLDTACSYNYLGGSFDTLYIKYNNTEYKLQHKDGAAYKLIPPTGASNTLIYFAELETPIDVSALEGTYKPAVADKNNKLTQVSIGEDGECYYIFDGNKYDSNTPSSDAKYGIVYCGQYLFSVKLDNDGNIAGINVSGGNFGNLVTYERTGDFVPGKIAIERDLEFVGADYMIHDNGNAQYWGEGFGDPTVEVTNFEKATNIYTVDTVKGGEVLGTYKLKIEGTGNDTVIKVYDKTGATLLDTLVKYFVNYVDLPTDGTSATSIPMADFKKDFYHFAATEPGWYKFDCTDANLEIYYGITSDLPTSTENAKKIKFVDGTATVYLASETIVGVKSLYSVENKPENVSINVGVTYDPPKGFVEEDPYEMSGLGELKVDALPFGNSLYITYTPAAAGSYFLSISGIDGFHSESFEVYYTVNGQPAGYDPTLGYWGDWVEGQSYENPEFDLIVSDTSPVSIIVTGNDFTDVVISVTKSYKEGATEVEFVKGTPVGGVLTSTANVSAGKYKVSDSYGSDVVITASSAFTAKVNGIEAEVTNADGTYTLTIDAGTEIYVEVSAAVTFAVTYEEGSEGYPYEISLTNGSYTFTVPGEKISYFVFTEAGSFIATCGYNSIEINGEAIEYGKSFTVAVGDVLKIDNYGGDTSLEVGIALPSGLSGVYAYTVGGEETLVTFGVTSLTVGGKEYTLSSVSGNTYTLTAEDNSTVTFVKANDNMTIDGHELEFKPVFNASQVGTYTGSIHVGEGDYAYDITLTLVLNADGTGTLNTGYWPAPFEEVTEEDGVYTIDMGFGDIYEFTFDGDGNIVINADNMGISNMTLNKASGTVYTGECTIDEQPAQIKLTINEDDITSGGTILVDDGSAFSAPVDITITDNGDNTYSFADSGEFNTGTFTVNGDTITITVVGVCEDLVLTK